MDGDRSMEVMDGERWWMVSDDGSDRSVEV